VADDLEIGEAINVGSYEDRQLIKDLYSRYAETGDIGKRGGLRRGVLA
jgi:hypothetical protein